MEVEGIEAGIEAILADYWYPFANYTYTDAEITKNPTDPLTEGKRPAWIPEHKFNVGLTYNNPRIITARLAGRYVGDKYYDERNTPTAEAGDFFVADAKIGRKFSLNRYLKDVNLSFAVNNIFDREYSEARYGGADEWSDGRNYWVELSFRF